AMKLWTHRRVRLLALVVGVGVAVGGVAYASIPDSGGVIHACYKKNGNHSLRVIDSSSSKEACQASEKPLDWSQTGPTGAAGPSGLSGLQTVSIASVNNSVSPKEAALVCPGGKMAVAGGAAITGGSVVAGTDLAATVALKASRPITLAGADAWTALAE